MTGSDNIKRSTDFNVESGAANVHYHFSKMFELDKFNLIYVIFKDFRSHDFIPINNLWIFKHELFFL